MPRADAPGYPILLRTRGTRGWSETEPTSPMERREAVGLATPYPSYEALGTLVTARGEVSL